MPIGALMLSLRMTRCAFAAPGFRRGHRSVDTVPGYFRAGAAQVSAVARMMDSVRREPQEG